MASEEASQLFVPQQTDALIRSRRKIEAIREVLDANPGASLKAAKDAVEAREAALQAGASPMAAPAPAVAADAGEGLPPQAVEAVRRGQTIEAIKHVREAYGLDLKTAKERVEAYARVNSGAAGHGLPPEAVEAMRRGRTVEAIQYVREAYGVDLRAAQERVEAYARRDSGAAGHGLPPDAVEAVRRGQTIEAIKHVREAYGLDLRTAKARVEAYARGDFAPAGGEGARIGDAAAPTHLPSDVVALLHGGDRGAACELLERKYSVATGDALRRIVEYEVGRKKRGMDGGARATVERGDGNGKVMLWALLVAGAVALVWWAMR